MPAAPSSLTDPVIGQLLPAAQALGSDLMRLLPVLASVPDPRARRGVRHKLAVILDLAVCAVLAGADPHDSPACPLSFGTIGCELRSSHTPAPFDEGRRPGSVPRTGGSHVRVVRRVDHVPVYVSDPHILFNVLTERLGLPAGMPVTRLPGFQSGVVVLGNVGLEVIRPAPGRRVGVPQDQGSFGIALEPEPLDAAIAELDRRSIAHLPPFPYPTPLPSGGLFAFDPKSVPPWTTAFIGGLLGDRVVARSASRMPPAVARWTTRILVRFWGNWVADRIAQRMTTPQVFLVEFHPQIRAAVDPGRMRGLLHDAGGGRIGLTGVRELVIGVPGIEREIERWQALLDPAPALGAGHWQLPSGPAIRLESSFGLSGRLICEVKDIDAAAAFLRGQELPGNSTDDELHIAPAALVGLDLRLVPA